MKSKITVVVNGSERELFMSYGLLNQLCRQIGDMDNVAQMAVDPDLQESVLVTVLLPRGKGGKPAGEFTLDDFEFDTDTALLLLDWVGEHVIDFFLKSLDQAKKMMVANETRISALMPSSAGSAS